MKSVTLALYGLLSLVGDARAHPSRGGPNQGLQTCPTVQTDSGAVRGHTAAGATGVSEYLGIPYAKPPVGELRFARPQRYSRHGTINGTSFGFSCPVSSTSSNALFPRPEQGLNFTAAGYQLLTEISQINEQFSEDCLTLNIWTKQKGEKRKAVMLWIHGGGFTGGSSNSSIFNGAHLAKQEDVVVVTINYRLNIFGFPGAPGVSNLALFDQRLAVEWVRDNIAGFGGDPSRITLFGQSAGAASVDAYSYAWTSDPIVAGFISQSGTTGMGVLPNSSTAAGQWFTVTAQLGCGDASSDANEVLSCMRSKAMTDITTAISKVPNFIPSIDEETVFSDYAQRSLAGNIAQKPMLIGYDDRESGMFDITSRMGGAVMPPEYWAGFDLLGFFCPAAVRANASVYNHLPVWRYRYFAEFENMKLSSSVDAGAWHGVEINQIFDTVPKGKGIPASPPREVALGKYVRGAWAAFAKDPARGLERFGWPQFDPAKKTLVRLGWENKAGLNVASSQEYDAPCGSPFPIEKAS